MSNEIKNVPDNRGREDNATIKTDADEVSGSSDCSFSVTAERPGTSIQLIKIINGGDPIVLAEIFPNPKGVWGPRRVHLEAMIYATMTLLSEAVRTGTVTMNHDPSHFDFRFVKKDGEQIYALNR
jgi:hypothetical protein